MRKVNNQQVHPKMVEKMAVKRRHTKAVAEALAGMGI